MKALKTLILIAATILCCLIQVQGVNDYSDSKRPYEFGFSIDGEQHRHEKKDKNGIIMGEFGFITADDVYHVTVYATDENGRFKILSMKNIHLKATPTYREGHSLQLPAATPSLTLPKQTLPQPLQASAPTQFIQKPQNNFKPVVIEPPANSCSHCSVPTTSTPAPKSAVLLNSQVNTNQYNSNPNLLNPLQTTSFQYPQSGSSSPNYPGQQNNFGGLSSSKPQSANFGSSNAAPLTPINSYNFNPSFPKQTLEGPRTLQQPNAGPTYTQAARVNTQNYPGRGTLSASSSANSPPYNSQDQNKINYRGQNEGVPRGVTPAPKFAPSYSQPSSKVPTPSNSNAPYNSQGENRFNSPVQNIRPPFGTPGITNYSPPNYQTQPSVTNSPGTRTAKQFSGSQTGPTRFNQLNYPQSSSPGTQGGQSVPKKPTLVSAQMQIVDKNTDIHHKRPGEKSGLPEGLTKNDMMHLLYTFNYTLGFQAHYEEGYTNGFKQGYYYVTGRNGVRTRVDYTADDTGFHPKISQDILDLLSDDVPKPETEKDAKYGLRGYEFKWLYYPVEDKSQ